MPAKITEVAAEAGVSIATVSRVMHQPSLVSASTRERVEAAIVRLGYRPNLVAAGLRSGVWRAVAVVVADVSQPWYANLTKALESTLDRWGFAAFLYDLDHDPERLLRYLDTSPQQGVAGLIVSTGDRLDHPGVPDAMLRVYERLPIVLAGQRLVDSGIPSVVYDDRSGARDAAEHLIETAGVPIAYLGYLPRSYLGEERYQGYAEVVLQHGQDPKAWAWPSGGYDYRHGYEAAARALAGGPPPRAILAANDQLAVGALRALRERGLSVPDEVAIVGFGDLDIAPYLHPALSSVEGSARKIAERCCKALMALIAGEPAPDLEAIERKLVVRDSSTHSEPRTGGAAATDGQR